MINAQEFSGFEYIEIDDSLRKLNGKADLYMKLLDKFSLSFDLECKKIQECYESGDIASVMAGLHYIKGSASNLGCYVLTSYIVECENLLDQRLTAEFKEYFFELERIWDKTLQEIDLFKTRCSEMQGAITPEVKPFNEEEFKDLLQRLDQNLDVDMGECYKIVSTLKKISLSENLRSLVQNMEDSLNDFDKLGVRSMLTWYLEGQLQ